MCLSEKSFLTFFFMVVVRGDGVEKEGKEINWTKHFKTNLSKICIEYDPSHSEIYI